MMKISDVCKHFFDPYLWKHMPDSEKERHGFNIIRFISIKFPKQVNAMNHKDMNMIDALNFWHAYLTPRIKATPQWFWTTAGSKKDQLLKDKKAKELKLTDEMDKVTIGAYCNERNIDYKMLLDIYEMDPKETLAKLKKFKSYKSSQE